MSETRKDLKGPPTKSWNPFAKPCSCSKCTFLLTNDDSKIDHHRLRGDWEYMLPDDVFLLCAHHKIDFPKSLLAYDRVNKLQREHYCAQFELWIPGIPVESHMNRRWSWQQNITTSVLSVIAAIVLGVLGFLVKDTEPGKKWVKEPINRIFGFDGQDPDESKL